MKIALAAVLVSFALPLVACGSTPPAKDPATAESQPDAPMAPAPATAPVAPMPNAAPPATR